MRLWKNENGQALVLAALSMSLLLGFMALAVDVGILFRARRNIQIAADAGAVAAALEYKYNIALGTAIASARAQSAGFAATTANGYANGTVVRFPTGTDTVSVTVNTTTPIDAVVPAIPGFAEVIVTAPNPTYFMSLFKYNGIKVSARAVAGRGTTENCVYLLGKTGTDFSNSGTINLGSSATTRCGLIDNSGYSNNGTVNALSIGVVGGVSSRGSGTPTPAAGIAPSGDPLNLNPPGTSGCTNLIIGSGGTRNVPGGCYSRLEISASGATVRFNGTYSFTGPFIVDSRLTGVSLQTGTGSATFYFANSSASITFNSLPIIQLSAPTSGPLNGILIYQSTSDTNTLPIEGAPGSSLQGIIYAPNAAVDLSNASGMSLSTSFVVNQLTNSGSSITLQDYLQINPSSPLAAVTLVE
jgi:Flp pilus assembly protein TadG